MAEAASPQVNTQSRAAELQQQLYAREIALCVKAGLSERELKEAGYNIFQLEQIRQGLNEHLDVSAYLHPQYSWLDMEEIRKGLKQGIDMTRYRVAGYSTEQKREIRKGIARGLDVSLYDKKEYLGEQMRQIRFGLMDKLPVMFYSNPRFNAAQMEELRLGLKADFDISSYADPEMPYLKMRAIRKSMEDGLVFTPEEIAKYDETILEQLHKAHVSGVDIRGYLEEGYNALQLEQIRISMEEKLSFRQYIRKDMRGESLKEIRLGLEAHLDVKPYADMKYRWRQMREIRLGLEARVNVSRYANPLFEASQMREIRLGLEAGLDVRHYNSLVYTAYDMRRMRLQLQGGKAPGRKLFHPDEIPAVYDDPILPYAERPDPRAMREALAREKKRLEARLNGRPVPAEEEEDLFALPPASEVPAGLHGTSGKQREEKQKKPRKELPKIDMKGQPLVITEDRMACYLQLPAPKKGASYSEAVIYSLLAKNHVVRGIDEAVVKALVRDKLYGQQLVVARGEEPENGKDGRYEYYFDRRSFTNPSLSEDGTADFSEARFFSEVKRGDVIASYLKAEPGTDGYTVTGEVLPARNGRERPVLKGRGFLLMEDRVSYAAAVSGVAKTDGYEMSINRLLTVEQDVIEPGKKIEFLGSIWLKGNVMPGTEIVAQGDVIIETVAESLKIKSGGDVVLKEGATGRTRGLIEAAGTVSGKYFANYAIHAQGSVFSNSFLHCAVVTEEKLVCFGEHGTVYGGSVQARLGVECAVVGTETGVPTVITLGITSKMIEEYNAAEKRLERAAEELKTLTAEMEKLAGLRLQTKEQMQIKIKINAAYTMKQKEFQDAEEERARIEDYINSVAGGAALISKTLYSGTAFIVDENRVDVDSTKEASEEKPIVIKGKAKQWQKIQRKS